MRDFSPRTITPDMAALGYNNEGRGELIGYISDGARHEKTCPHYLDQKKTCACRVGLWQEHRASKPAVAKKPKQRAAKISDAQIKHMVDRFLGWKLPADFRPDGGVIFQRFSNGFDPNDDGQPNKPSGTNLLDATQAEAMIRHLIDGLPSARA